MNAHTPPRAGALVPSPSHPAQAHVDGLRELLDLIENFSDNDQRARYILSSNWLRDLVGLDNLGVIDNGHRDAHTPPAPIWGDELAGLTVWVNGGVVEICSSELARLMPHETAAVAREFAVALAEASSWAARWDTVTSSYSETL